MLQCLWYLSLGCLLWLLHGASVFHAHVFVECTSTAVQPCVARRFNMGVMALNDRAICGAPHTAPLLRLAMVQFQHIHWVDGRHRTHLQCFRGSRIHDGGGCAISCCWCIALLTARMILPACLPDDRHRASIRQHLLCRSSGRRSALTFAVTLYFVHSVICVSVSGFSRSFAWCAGASRFESCSSSICGSTDVLHACFIEPGRHRSLHHAGG